jgi:HK97 family phage major capsid protein
MRGLPSSVASCVAVILKAHKANIFCRVSAELAADVPMFDRQLGSAIVRGNPAGLDIAFLNGTGAGQPLGIINAGNTITVSKEGSQAASTVLIQNPLEDDGPLSPASFARAVWLIHPTVVVPLYMMSVVVTNLAASEVVGGSNRLCVTVDGNGQVRIFGRPCIVTDACSALSSLGDIILADLSKYLIGMRAGHHQEG